MEPPGQHLVQCLSHSEGFESIFHLQVLCGGGEQGNQVKFNKVARASSMEKAISKLIK